MNKPVKLSAFLVLMPWGTPPSEQRHMHWCPACKEMHPFAVEQPFSNGHRWSFDGNVDRPTFEPSMNISWGEARCHYFLRAGQIQYLGDCTHELRGQTVALPPIPDDWLKRWEEMG